MADHKIISELKYKNSNGNFESYMLGPEQRYIGALRNGSVNNLEEQYLFGTDTYIETYQDLDDNEITEISYHKNNVEHKDAKDYYKVKICVYKTPIPYGGIIKNPYHFDGHSFIMPYAPEDVHFSNEEAGISINVSPRTDYVINGELDLGDIQVLYDDASDPALYMENRGIFNFDDNNNLNIINPTSSSLQIKKEELWYITETEEILVLSKDIVSSAKIDHGITKSILFEIITDKLI